MSHIINGCLLIESVLYFDLIRLQY